MIIGIGLDIIEVERIEKALSNPAFAARVFTEREQAYCEAAKAGKYQSYAARYAAKEALGKALGTGLNIGNMLEIEVVKDPLGKPEICLEGKTLELAQSKGCVKIHLSLTHVKGNALAQVVVEGRE